MLYVVKCWSVKNSHIQKLNVKEMRMLCWICGPTRRDRESSGNNLFTSSEVMVWTVYPLPFPDPTLWEFTSVIGIIGVVVGGVGVLAKTLVLFKSMGHLWEEIKIGLLMDDPPVATNGGQLCMLQMTMVYGLLKHKIKYKGDDEELKDEDKKMDKIWITTATYWILRWLFAKNNSKINPLDLFILSDDAVVHSWLVPTEQELEMPSFPTLGIVETKIDPKIVDDIFDDDATDLGTSGGDDGVGVGYCDGICNIGIRHGDEHIDDAHEYLFEKRVDHDDGHIGGGYGGFTFFSGHTTSFGPSSSSCFDCKC
ncbi:hypothetical protein FXO37_34516 [Capsicum annuum]|nr:hypothetical protein FXO37_34516 [Capsicum annuum]